MKSKTKVIVASGPIFLSTAEEKYLFHAIRLHFRMLVTLDLINLAKPVKFSLKIGFFL